MSRPISRAAAFVSALLFAACGGSDGTGPSEGLVPPPALVFTLTSPASQVEIPASVTIQATIRNATSCRTSFAGSIPPRDGIYNVPVSTVGNHEFSGSCTGLDGSTKTASVMVRAVMPSISGKIFCPTLANCIDDARVYVSKGSIIDSTVDLDPDGSFRVETFLKGQDSVTALLGNRGGKFTGGYYPSRALLRKEWHGSVTFIRAIRNWQVLRGTYAGQVFPFSPDLAFTIDLLSHPKASSFYRRAGSGNTWFYADSYIPDSHFPMPAAFDRDSSTHAFTSADSLFIWAAIDSAEKVHGQDLVRPANLSDLPAGQGLRMWVDANFDGTADAGPRTNNQREIVGGKIIAQDISVLRSPLTFSHEWLHVMGFGHSCGWRTIMGNLCADELKSNELTVGDLAYKEAWYETVRLKRTVSARFWIPEAKEGELWEKLGSKYVPETIVYQ